MELKPYFQGSVTLGQNGVLRFGPACDVRVGGAGGCHVEDLLRDADEAVIEMLRRLHDDDAVVGGLGADRAEAVGVEGLVAARADRDVDMLRRQERHVAQRRYHRPIGLEDVAGDLLLVPLSLVGQPSGLCARG